MKKRQMGKAPKCLLKAIAIFSAAALLAGCGASGSAEYKNAADSARYESSSYSDSKGDYYGEEALWEDGSMDMAEAGSNPSAETYSKTSASKRKLIKTVNMNVETQEYETLMSNLEKRVKELGGYVQNLESYNGSRYGYGSRNDYYVKRYANMTLRIPQERLDEFVNSISDLANVVNRSERVDDVTLQYVDVKSHKESLQVEQERLLALLERAEKLEDIITLENRLTNVRYQIESMESTLRTFDDQVDYSTVTLRVDEVEVYTPVEVKKQSNWERMTNGFVESLVDVRDGIVNFCIWVVIHLPYLVIWAIVITVIVLIIRRSSKKKHRKHAENEAKTNEALDKLSKINEAKKSKTEEKNLEEKNSEEK